MAILNARFAVDNFGSWDKILGRSIVIAALPYQVVGVAPPGFDGMFGEHADIWVPATAVIPLLLNPPSKDFSDESAWKTIAAFYALAGSQHATSPALTRRLTGALQTANPGGALLHVSPGLTAEPVRDENYRKRLRLGLALCLTFTIISSLNFALLLLARMPRDAEQIRLKRVLGADSFRLAAESVAGPAALVALGLFCAGLVLGAGIAIVARMPGFYGQAGQATWQAAAFAYVAQFPFALLLTLAISLAPMLSLLRESFSHDSGSTRTGSKRASLYMQIAVVLEIALTTGTWLLAGMIATSLLRDIRQPLGYNPEGLYLVRIGPSGRTLTIAVSGGGISPLTMGLATLIRLVERVPGVDNAAYTSATPFEREKGAPPSIARGDGTGLAAPHRSASTSSVRAFSKPWERELSAGEVFLRTETGAK